MLDVWELIVVGAMFTDFNSVSNPVIATAGQPKWSKNVTSEVKRPVKLKESIIKTIDEQFNSYPKVFFI